MFISKKNFAAAIQTFGTLFFCLLFSFFVTPPFSYNQQVIIYYVNIIFVSFID